MHCDIRDIENIIKGRINYYSYLAKDIEALGSGAMSGDEAAEALEYLRKETGFSIPMHPVERSEHLTMLTDQCKHMMKYYLQLKTCLLYADKDIGIMGLYVSLEYSLEEAQVRKAAGIGDLNDMEQLKQLRSALIPYIPQDYHDLRKGIHYSVNEETFNVSIKFNLRYLTPLRNKADELGALIIKLAERMPPNSITNTDEEDVLLQSMRELKAEGQKERESTSPNNLIKDIPKFIMSELTHSRSRQNIIQRYYEALQKTYRDLRKVKSNEQLQQAVIAAKNSIHKQASECIERISVCLLDLDNSHRKLIIENYGEMRTRLDNLFNQLQESQHRTVLDLNESTILADVHRGLERFASKVNKTTDFIYKANELIQQNQIKIIEEKGKTELLRQQSQKAEEDKVKELHLKHLAAFKAEQAEKLLLRKAEIVANREKNRLQRSTMFATSTSTSIQQERPANTMAVNQVMYERLINLHEKHLDLIISILQASGGIAYRDVVNLIKNQLAGDIIEHGSSHKTFIIERLAVQVYTNENNQLVAVSETLTAGMAKPHNPGHTEHHLSKWNIKLVRNALVAAGITLSAMEEIIATQEQDRVNQSYAPH